METMDYLNDYYGQYDEDGRLNRNRRGELEYLTTMGYIQAYLKPGDRVLEVGAGTGRYSLTIAELGAEVTAVEPVKHNLEILRGKIAPGQNVTALEGAAENLSMLESGSYDMTLLLGPMYHLATEEQRMQAMAEAIRVTKPGGVIMAAYCIAEGSILKYGFGQHNIARLIGSGQLSPRDFAFRNQPEDVFMMLRKADIDRMMRGFPAQRLHYVATDGPGYLMQDMLEHLSEEEFQLYLAYHLTVCENADLVGATGHSLDVLRKLEN